MLLLLSACAAGGGGDSGGGELVPTEVPCTPEQAWPYASGVPYLGVHADAGNTDRVRCATGNAFGEDWHALAGHGVVQPNTFSPDGARTYVTTTAPGEEDCRLWALDTATGEVAWCLPMAPAVAGSAVEVDEDGLLYVAAGAELVSLTADGEVRWTADLGLGEAGEGTLAGALGQHFTRDGWLATVTTDGRALLLDRADGAVVAELDVKSDWDLVNLPGLGEGLDVLGLFPQAVQEDFVAVFGSETAANALFAAFLGAGGGAWCDNTVGVGVTADGGEALYVIGGGRDEDHGALVQVRIEEDTDGDGLPELVPGWLAETEGGSATTPSITPDGRYVAVSDGVSSTAFLDPAGVTGRVLVYDAHVCDAPLATDPTADCMPVAAAELERGAMAGAPALMDDGTVVFWELAVGVERDWTGARDLGWLSVDGGVVEGWVLPDDLDWSSVITVTDTHVVGTGTRRTGGSGEQLFATELAATAESELLVLDRESGDVVWRAPVPDDASATVTVGPDGALYVGMLGLLSLLAVDTEATLGLVRFGPREELSAPER